MVKCDQCQFRCLRTCDLAKHKRKKHSSPLTTKNSDFDCDICDYSAKTQRNLDQHKTLHVLPEDVELFECSKCDYKTLKASYMNRHLVKHKKIGNNETKKTVKISKTTSTSFTILSQNRILFRAMVFFEKKEVKLQNVIFFSKREKTDDFNVPFL